MCVLLIIDMHKMRSNLLIKELDSKLNGRNSIFTWLSMRPRDFKRMTLRTHVISTMRFDGHLSDGYLSTYRHM